MIKLENVTKRFRVKNGWHTVFENLSLEIPEGHRLALLGKNGAGKTTLMSLISGSVMPDAGRVHRMCSVSWPIGLASGFQGSLTGRENVIFVSRIHGDSAHRMRQRIEYVREFAEIGDYFDMPMNSYSSGMRSRVAFGMSMAFDFDIYLVDEVVAVGDASFKRKCQAAFEEKRKKGAGLIMVSHDMATVSQWCDSALYIERGQHSFHSDVKEAVERYQKCK